MNGHETGYGNYAPSLIEQLTACFYLWERRGRGWQIWDYSVEIEPPFEPFYRHEPPAIHQSVDDGRRPTWLSSIVDWIKGENRTPAIGPNIALHLIDGLNNSTSPETVSDFLSPAPSSIAGSSHLKEISLFLPKDQRVTPEIAHQFLLSLGYCAFPISFEIVGSYDSIIIQLVCHDRDFLQIQQQLKAYFPAAGFKEEDRLLEGLWDLDKETVIVDFGLSSEFMRPLNTFRSFEIDPLIGIIGALENLERHEIGGLQFLFQAVHNPWAESILRSLIDREGRPFFLDAPEMIPLAKEKVSNPLFAVVIRSFSQSPKTYRAWEIARTIGSGLLQAANPPSNELIPLDNAGYENLDHTVDVLLRQTHRSGMILNSHELISFVHPPSVSVQSKKLQREVRKTKEVPDSCIGHELRLGENLHQGETSLVTLSREQRLRHMYVIGATGTGKSTLLQNLIFQDIQNGLGLAVLDPHGDLIDSILGYIPEERFQDVVLLDPSDEEFPIGLNILSANSEAEKNVLASDLVSVFRRLSTSWGDQMTSVLSNAILAFLESKKGGTLLDLRRFLVEKDYRHQFLKTVQDPQVVYYWHKEFPLLVGRPLGPILTRLNMFLRPKLVRYMVAQNRGLNFNDILNTGKIFLVKLAQGLIGEENSYLLGTLIVSKLHQGAMARQAQSIGDRKDFFLYIDEFQNFLTLSMASILSGARKYRLGLVLAHQELRQLWNQDTEVANSVISNPGTRVCFRLGDFDSKKLEHGFSYFDALDLENLGVGEAIARIDRADFDFNLKTFPAPEIEDQQALRNQEALISLSREKYGAPRKQIEELLEKENVWAVEQEKPAKNKKESKEPLQEAVETGRPPESTAKEDLKKPVDTPENNKKAKKEKATAIAEEVLKPEFPIEQGKGGPEHRYLQALIKKIAEEYGYKAVIEQEIPGGSGQVDIGLEKDGKIIACEVSVTTSETHEMKNIEKCLETGYEQVILCSPKKTTLNRVNDMISQRFDEAKQKKVLTCQPEELFYYFEEQAARQAGKEETIKGYKVKVSYRPLEKEEKMQKREAISQVIMESLRRRKKRK